MNYFLVDEEKVKNNKNRLYAYKFFIISSNKIGTNTINKNIY